MTYKFLGNSLGANHYQVTLTIYADYANATVGAIAADNPAEFGVFDGTGKFISYDTASVFGDTVYSVPDQSMRRYAAIAGTDQENIYNRDYLLPPNSTGYVIAYQKCCRNVALDNITDPGNAGAAYFCTPYRHRL